MRNSLPCGPDPPEFLCISPAGVAPSSAARAAARAKSSATRSRYDAVFGGLGLRHQPNGRTGTKADPVFLPTSDLQIEQAAPEPGKPVKIDGIEDDATQTEARPILAHRPLAPSMRSRSKSA